MRAAEKALRNSIFSLTGLLAGYGSSLALAVIVARSLGPQGTGYYNYGLWVASALLTPGGFGLSTTVTRFVAEATGAGDNARAQAASSHGMKAQAVFALVVAACACIIFLLQPHSAYRDVMLAGAIVFVPSALIETSQAALNGIQRYGLTAKIQSVGSLFVIAAMAAAAYWKPFPAALLSAHALGLAFTAIVLLLALNRTGLIRGGSLPAGGHRRFWRFSSIAAFLSLLGMVLWQRSELWFLERYSTAAEIGFFSLAFSFAGKLEDFSNSISSTLLPISAESFGKEGMENLGAYYVRAIVFVQMAVLPCCVVGILLSRPIVTMLFGVRFGPVALLLSILLAGVAISHLAAPAAAVFYAADRHRTLAWMWTPAAMLNLVLAFLWIRSNGSMGAAVATVVAQSIATVAATAAALRICGVLFPWKSTARIYVALILAAAPLAATIYLHSVPGISVVGFVLGAALYPWLLAKLGVLRQEDWQMLRNTFIRFAAYGFGEHH